MIMVLCQGYAALLELAHMIVGLLNGRACCFRSLVILEDVLEEKRRDNGADMTVAALNDRGVSIVSLG